MGIFDFAKKAGASVQGADKAKGITAHINDLGLDIKDLDVKFDDGVATVSGDVKDQATKEKVILAAGNVEGVEKVKDELKVEGGESAGESQMYEVVEGDTLSALAQKYYGDASKYNIIFEANTPMLKDPDLIYVGQVLRIPAQ